MAITLIVPDWISVQRSALQTTCSCSTAVHCYCSHSPKEGPIDKQHVWLSLDPNPRIEGAHVIFVCGQRSHHVCGLHTFQDYIVGRGLIMFQDCTLFRIILWTGVLSCLWITHFSGLFFGERSHHVYGLHIC